MEEFLKYKSIQMVFEAFKLVFEMNIIQAFTEVLVRAPILGTTPCWKKYIYFKIRRFWAETQLAMK
jgi:hypothetical protein